MSENNTRPQLSIHPRNWPDGMSPGRVKSNTCFTKDTPTFIKDTHRPKSHAQLVSRNRAYEMRNPRKGKGK